VLVYCSYSISVGVVRVRFSVSLLDRAVSFFCPLAVVFFAFAPLFPVASWLPLDYVQVIFQSRCMLYFFFFSLCFSPVLLFPVRFRSFWAHLAAMHALVAPGISLHCAHGDADQPVPRFVVAAGDGGLFHSRRGFFFLSPSTMGDFFILRYSPTHSIVLV